MPSGGLVGGALSYYRLLSSDIALLCKSPSRARAGSRLWDPEGLAAQAAGSRAWGCTVPGPFFCACLLSADGGQLGRCVGQQRAAISWWCSSAGAHPAWDGKLWKGRYGSFADSAGAGMGSSSCSSISSSGSRQWAAAASSSS